MKRRILIQYLLFAYFIPSDRIFANPSTLANLDYSNPILKSLRSDVKENLRLSRSKQSDDKLIPLRYFQYTVKKDDSFFKIMARTGMDLETLSSVNELSSPHDLVEGMVLEIPNMRGVFHPETSENSLKNKQLLADKYHLPNDKLQYDSAREKWFIPGVVMGKVEKSFFYGFGFTTPLKTVLMSSAYGNRLDPFTKKTTFHGGIDLAAKHGSSVHASQDGIVEFASTSGGYGKLIIIKHAMGYETRYGHLDTFLVKSGERIKKGEKIGEVGMTGRTTGPHLHFEVRRNSKRQKPFFQSHL